MSSSQAEPPADGAQPGGAERRRAPRKSLNSHAELVVWPASSRTAPIRVEVRDVSDTGVGILHHEPLRLGEKYVVKEPTIAKMKCVLFTVVRSQQIDASHYIIGMHASHLVEEEEAAAKLPPSPHARTNSMAKLLTLAMLMGGLLAVLTLR